MWLSTQMWDKFIYVFLALSPCVLIQQFLHVAGLDLGLNVLVSFNITGSSRERKESKNNQSISTNESTFLAKT